MDRLMKTNEDETFFRFVSYFLFFTERVKKTF